MAELNQALSDALEFSKEHGIDVPAEIVLRAYNARALKAVGDLGSINAQYHDEITSILTGYFEGANLASSRNSFKRAIVESFGSAFDLGWTDGGQELPPSEEALSWFNARIEAEFGNVEMLFQQAKELRKDKEFSYFDWVTQRADGYTRTIKEVYNAAKMRATKDKMVKFDGDDGSESCPDCQNLKGKRHKISWFVKRNYVPPFGTGLECHPGGRCQHGLFDDEGNQVTA